MIVISDLNRNIQKRTEETIRGFLGSIYRFDIAGGALKLIYNGEEMPTRRRVETLNAYRMGNLQVLVTCRALDEGFNVPETQIGIIAASTATRRQRIQRLGRVLRPVAGKELATVYPLVATGPEIERLREEETELEGIADVTWSRG